MTRIKEDRIALWHMLGPTYELQLKSMVKQGFQKFHFDDGYADILRAADALESHGKRGTFFIVTGWLGLEGFATAQDIVALHQRGHEIGNHTHSHVLIHRVPFVVAKYELEKCQNYLELLTGVVPQRLAWPYGLSSRRVRQLADDMGFVERRNISDTQVVPLEGPRL